MANIETGEVRPWDSLTDEERSSGKWIRLPDGTEGGAARRRSLADDVMDTLPAAPRDDRLLSSLMRPPGPKTFDATGKAR